MREGDVALAEAAAYPEIEVVERGGFKIEDYFAGTGVWRGSVLVLQDFAAPEGVEADCLHGRSLTFGGEFPVLRGSPDARERQLAHEDKFLRELVVEFCGGNFPGEGLLFPPAG